MFVRACIVAQLLCPFEHNFVYMGAQEAHGFVEALP
jgi:hypothetical protein